MKMQKTFLAGTLMLLLAVQGCKPKDSDIQSAVQSKEITGVIVSVNDGVVTLSGEVADASAKANAETIAGGQKHVKSVVNNIGVAAPVAPDVTDAPVTIASDEPLMASVRDAIKDYPGVTATVSSGVIMLSGSIKKERNMKLMMALNGLHAKRIDNSKLTIN